MTTDESSHDMGSGPDPTVATLALMARQIDSLKELFDQRLRAIDKSIEVAHANAVRIPTETQKAVSGMHELIESEFRTHLQMFKIHDERFAGIALQFLAAEKIISIQQGNNNAAAMKSETAFTKLIDQQSGLIFATKNELATSIDGLKDRVTTIQAMSTGNSMASQSSRDNLGTWVAVGGLALAGLIALVGVVMFVANRVV